MRGIPLIRKEVKMKKFENIIARKPAQTIVEGITMNPQLGKVDYKLCCEQHEHYLKTLKDIGLDIYVIEPDDTFPDSVFVEDAALLTDKCAVITNPGAPSRNGEKTEMAAHVAQFYDPKHIHYIQFPGTLDAGDVMMVDNDFYVGKTARTNQEGIDQLTKIFKPYGYNVIAVPVSEGLHLKSSVSYLEHNNLLITSDLDGNPIFDKFNKIHVPDDEKYCANSIWLNETVIVPKGYPKTLKMIEDLNQYKVVLCDTSEIRKLDGGLSCTSLRFKAPKK